MSSIQGPVNNQPPVGSPPVGFSDPAPATEQDILDTLSSLNSLETTQGIFTSPDHPQIKKPALFVVMQTVASAVTASKAISFSSDAAISRLNASFYRDMIFISQNVLNRLIAILTIQILTDLAVQSINDSITTENASIQFQNQFDDSAVTTVMRDAQIAVNNAYDTYQIKQQQFINNQITQDEFLAATDEYNVAIAVYNNIQSQYSAIAAIRNPQITAYNQSITTYNTAAHNNNILLAQINVSRLDLGLPPLPLQPLMNPLIDGKALYPTVNPAPPLPVTLITTIDSSPISLIPDYPVPDSLIVSLFNPLLSLILSMTNQLLTKIASNQAYNDFYNFFLRTKVTLVTLAKAFGPETASSNVETGGSSSNAGLACIANALDPVVTAQLFNKGNQDAYTKAFTSVLGLGVFDATLLANSKVLSSLEAIAGKSLFDRLQPNGVDIQNAPLSTALALEFATTVSQASSNNGLKEGLSQELGIDVNNPALNALNAILNLSNLGIAISQLSSSQGLPGLGAQLLLAAGLPLSDVFNLTAQGTGINNFLFNPITQNIAGNALAASILNSLGGTLSSSQQAGLQNAILSAAAQTSPLSPNAFFTNLAGTLNGNNLSGNLANQILEAAQVGIFSPISPTRTGFRSDIVNSLQANGISYGEALQIAAGITGTSATGGPGATFAPSSLNQELLTSNLAYNIGLIGVTSQQEIANQVIKNLTANQTEVSEETFRANLQHELEVSGLNKQQALRVATGVAFPFGDSSHPLSAFVTTNQMSYQDLRQSINQSIQSYFEPIIGARAANIEATRYTNAIVGKELSDPNSLVNALGKNIQELHNNQDQSTFNKSVDNFKDYLKPSTDLYTFNNRLTSVAYQNLYAQDLIHQQAVNTGPVRMGGTIANPIMGPA